MTTLLDAKRDEFIGLFTDAQPNEKTQAKAILTEIDGANAQKYQKMVSGGDKERKAYGIGIMVLDMNNQIYQKALTY